MKGKTARFVLATAIAVAMLLLLAGSAFAAAHVTHYLATSDTMSASLDSTGDAGSVHGNLNPSTSPIFPAPQDGWGGWFNQDVMMGDPTSAQVEDGFHLVDTADADDDIDFNGGFWQSSMDNVTWGPEHTFDASSAPLLTAEGLYSVTTTGTDGDDPVDVTATITPAFGIDKTPPVTGSDAVAYYGGGSATVNITATDALSGVQDIRVSIDGAPWDYEFDSDAVANFTTGSHTLSWEAFDNAGNSTKHSTVNLRVFAESTFPITSSAGANGSISPLGITNVAVGGNSPAFSITANPGFHVADVLVDGVSVGAVTSYTFNTVIAPHTIAATFASDFIGPFHPAITVRTNVSGSDKHRVRFNGTITAMPLDQMMTLVVKRLSGTKYVWYSQFSFVVPANTTGYSMTQTVPKDGKFRVQATCSGGASNLWKFATH